MQSQKQCFVGLGNPGNQYQTSRHNVGWLVLDQLAAKLGIAHWSIKQSLHAEIGQAGEYILVKPQTFMNNSGQAVKRVVDYYSLDTQKLWVIHDDLDLPLGQFKIQWATGPKIHNGLISLYDNLKTRDFWHVRIGIDTRAGDRSMPPEAYVLQQLTKDEKIVIASVTEIIIQRLLN